MAWKLKILLSRSSSVERRSRDDVPDGPAVRHDFSESRHRGIGTGAVRAAIFGVSDGLITNISLILGIAGAHPAGTVVRLAGVAGLGAGACSMAAGEYVSMRAQRELMERDLEVERMEIETFPEAEHHELAGIYESRGMERELSRTVATIMMSDRDVALWTHAREELGINPGSLGSPFRAASASFASFALGALIPLIPWLVTSGWVAVASSAGLAALAAIGVGVLVAKFTHRSWLRTASRQLGVSCLAAGVSFAIGTGVGMSGFA